MLKDVTTHLWLAGQNIQPQINRGAAIEKLRLVTALIVQSTLVTV